MAIRFTAEQVIDLRARLMKKGLAIATLLSQVLANKDKQVNLAMFPDVAKKRGMKPEERLRAFLNFIEDKRKLIDAEDDAYGRCKHCAADLGLVELTEMPWADCCRECAVSEH